MSRPPKIENKKSDNRSSNKVTTAKGKPVSKTEKKISAGRKSNAKDQRTAAEKDASSRASVSAEQAIIDDSTVDEIPIEPSDEKLQKVLARAGLGSRREMEKSIAAGLVMVNGVAATLGDRVSSADVIDFQGRRVRQANKEDQRLRVLLYNKPEGQICSKLDPEGRPTVYENLPKLNSGRWISVGRLDFNTSGLLLFTNNGELANKLMHPSANIDREYLIRVQGDVDNDMLQRMRDGVELDDGVAKFTDIKAGSSEGSNLWFYCVVMEGRNREVRRLWESQGVRVSRLKRVRYGNVFIPSHVRMGQWVELEDEAIADIHATAGLAAPKKGRFSPKVEETRNRHQRKLRASSKLGAPNLVRKKRPSPGRD